MTGCRRVLAERYDYACVNDADQLAQVARGVTLAGQVKRGPTSFEKIQAPGG